MRRFLGVTLVVAVVTVLAAVAFAQMGGGPGGSGMMGGGMMGSGMMGGMGGQAGCAGMTTTGTSPGTTISEEKARELAQQYADRYLKGFAVDKVLPFTGMHHTMFSVELKGPKDEVRTLHINPFGNVMPFGGPGRQAG